MLSVGAALEEEYMAFLMKRFSRLLPSCSLFQCNQRTLSSGVYSHSTTLLFSVAKVGLLFIFCMALISCVSRKPQKNFLFWLYSTESIHPEPVCQEVQANCIRAGRSKGEDLRAAILAGGEAGDKARAELQRMLVDPGGYSEEFAAQVCTLPTPQLIREVDRFLSLPDCDDVRDDVRC